MFQHNEIPIYNHKENNNNSKDNQTSTIQCDSDHGGCNHKCQLVSS